MSQWGFQKGLNGEEEPSIADEKRDWRAGMQARLANQDLARRIRDDEQPSSSQDWSSYSPGPKMPLLTAFPVACLFALISWLVIYVFWGQGSGSFIATRYFGLLLWCAWIYPAYRLNLALDD
jgi:hypothetical protein